jgi:hypothetical protein
LSKASFDVDITKPFNEVIYLRAKSPDAVSKVEKIISTLFVSCGEEKMLFDAKDLDLKNIIKSEISETPLKYNLDDLWTITHPNAYINKTQGCPIQEFKLCS